MEKVDLTQVYKLRQDFILLGLTGRTGSGCSTVSDILNKSKFIDCKFAKPEMSKTITNDERKEVILFNYLKSNWRGFTVICVSDIISTTLLENDFEDIKKYFIEQFTSDNAPENHIPDALDSIKVQFEKLKTEYNSITTLEDGSNDKKKKLYEFYFDGSIKTFSNDLKKITINFKSLQAETVYQALGTNLRSSGNAIKKEIAPENAYFISSKINEIIKAIKHVQNNQAHIIIDSIRNSIESMFFKERYSAYYLIAINSENEYRYSRLNAKSKLNKDQVDKIDEIEYSTKRGIYRFISQDIKSCIQNADIYIHNPTDEKPGDTLRTLKKQLVKYISLILHPGLVTPSPVERCMQIAYTAKYNSGCISRQVGAVVSDNYFSLKSIGWNNTAEGQVPCLLRSIDRLYTDDKIAYSDYELEETFKNVVHSKYDKVEQKEFKELLQGRNVSFCFKDIQNSIDGDRNQVYTRSLHAEENAFLQISKYGGMGVNGGFLFTTASPCELCSKKAYQLGIARIYYIEPYPGIAGEQILRSGVASKRPSLRLFKGAIGRAYHQLYHPFIPYKDELQIILNLSNEGKKMTKS